MNMSMRISLFLAAVVAAGASLAAEPPSLVNYQGVLRDSADQPLDGTYDMVFRFFGPAAEEIMIDRHTNPFGGPVDVGGGLFDVRLGDGAPLDGSGPGTYVNLADVFRDYGEVWLEIQIGADGAPDTEVLSPRVRIVSAAYALNAGTVNGFESAHFLDVSPDAQTKAGPLAVDAGAIGGSTGIEAVGSSYGAYIRTSTGTGLAWIGNGNTGIDARGTSQGGSFLDSDSSGFAELAVGDYGVDAGGNLAGGFFLDTNSTGMAYLGYGDVGTWSSGAAAGGYFRDADHSGYAYVGYGNRGIQAIGSEAGGYFQDNDSSGYAFVGYLDEGISAHGTVQGGYFQDDDSTGLAHVAYGDTGIEARGDLAGGYFLDSGNTAYAYVGYGNNGISAYGNAAGGFFRDQNSSAYGYVGQGDGGIRAYGNAVGGYFQDLDSSGYAYVGSGDAGIEAYGDGTGGYFRDTNASAVSYVAVQNIGIDARGEQAGGYFADNGEVFNSGYAYVGYGDVGIVGYGDLQGARFESSGGDYADVAEASFKIQGTGAVSFVQNHPQDVSRVIVYTAPEGDEVATYTRGSARLVDGVARVALGETFAWVTNPDLGLTAHVTSRSPDAVVYVESVSTDELVVRNVSGFPSDSAFDYLVYGLRIGFEERAVVRPKTKESFIPSMANDRGILDREPELRGYTAFDRFKEMRSDLSVGDGREIDLAASRALHDVIHEYDPATDPPVRELLGFGPGRRGTEPEATGENPSVDTRSAGDVVGPVIRTGSGSASRADERPSSAIVEPTLDFAMTFPVAERVEPGELLALDPNRPGLLTRATGALDPGIVGIAAEAPREVEGVLRVALVDGNYALVKADAGYGEIRPGDLLTASYTPGHAMSSAEIVPGTVIGKALEPLESGIGLIRVLVMPR